MNVILDRWIPTSKLKHMRSSYYDLMDIRMCRHFTEIQPLQRSCRCVFYGDLYPNDECYNDTTAGILNQLLIARKEFAYGPMVDYFEHRNCIGFVRMGDSNHAGCAVVISNDPM